MRRRPPIPTRTAPPFPYMSMFRSTSSRPHARKMSVGRALGRGQTLGRAVSSKCWVAEGVASAPAVLQLAAKLAVDTPICEAVAAILAGEVEVDAAIQD